MDEVNSLFDAKGHAAVRDRCALILQHCKVSFVGYPVAKKAGCEAFAENLELVNSELKIVIPHMLYNYFFFRIFRGRLKQGCRKSNTRQSGWFKTS